MYIAFEDNKREVYEVTESDTVCHKYMCVSMTPSNWYQWFDPKQADDPAWITVCINTSCICIYIHMCACM